MLTTNPTSTLSCSYATSIEFGGKHDDAFSHMLWYEGENLRRYKDMSRASKVAMELVLALLPFKNYTQVQFVSQASSHIQEPTPGVAWLTWSGQHSAGDRRLRGNQPASSLYCWWWQCPFSPMPTAPWARKSPAWFGQVWLRWCALPRSSCSPGTRSAQDTQVRRQPPRPPWPPHFGKEKGAGLTLQPFTAGSRKASHKSPEGRDLTSMGSGLTILRELEMFYKNL